LDCSFVHTFSLQGLVENRIKSERAFAAPLHNAISLFDFWLDALSVDWIDWRPILKLVFINKWIGVPAHGSLFLREWLMKVVSFLSAVNWLPFIPLVLYLNAILKKTTCLSILVLRILTELIALEHLTLSFVAISPLVLVNLRFIICERSFPSDLLGWRWLVPSFLTLRAFFLETIFHVLNRHVVPVGGAFPFRRLPIIGSSLIPKHVDPSFLFSIHPLLLLRWEARIHNFTILRRRVLLTHFQVNKVLVGRATPGPAHEFSFPIVGFKDFFSFVRRQILLDLLVWLQAHKSLFFDLLQEVILFCWLSHLVLELT